MLPKQEIGLEKHMKISQFFRIEEGSGYALIKGQKNILKSGSSIIVDPNTYHNIVAGKNGMKLYSPPVHNINCKQKHKEDNEC